MKKQKIWMGIPRPASVKGKLFLEFCVHHFGPNSTEMIWGKMASISDILQKSKKGFEKYYFAHYEQRGGTDRSLNIDPTIDLCGAIVQHPLNAGLTYKVSDNDQLYMGVFIENITQLLMHQSDYPWKEYERSRRGINLSNPEIYEYRSEADIAPTNASYGLLFERD